MKFSSDRPNFETADPIQDDRYLSERTNERLAENNLRPRTAGSTVHWQESPDSTRSASVSTVVKTSGVHDELLSPPASRRRRPPFFGLLSVKEPSSQALREYEELLKKQQNKEKGRPSAVGMPMISAAKLPASVPKVNSKWDGLPEAVRRRQKETVDFKWKGFASDSRLTSSNSSNSSLRLFQTRPTARSARSLPSPVESRAMVNARDTLLQSDGESFNGNHHSTLPSPATINGPRPEFNDPHSPSEQSRPPSSELPGIDDPFNSSNTPADMRAWESPGSGIENQPFSLAPRPAATLGSQPVDNEQRGAEGSIVECEGHNGDWDRSLTTEASLPSTLDSSRHNIFTKLKPKGSRPFRKTTAT